MNIGIIALSQSGNTESVAQKIKEEVSTDDKKVTIEMITVKGEVKPEKKEYEFENKPVAEPYDLIIFAAAVNVFSLNSAMKYYLKQLDSLEDKKVFCFVTKALPFNWTGGSPALKQMKNICKTKGAEICGGGIVKWREKSRSNDIESLIGKVKQVIN